MKKWIYLDFEVGQTVYLKSAENQNYNWYSHETNGITYCLAQGA